MIKQVQNILNIQKPLSNLQITKAILEYSNYIRDVNTNINDCNPNTKLKILNAFDDMTNDMIRNKKVEPVVTESGTHGRKLKVPTFLNTQLHFAVPKFYY